MTSAAHARFMRVWPDLVARVGIASAILAVVWGLAGSFGLVARPHILAFILLFAPLMAVGMFGVLLGAGWGRTAPVRDQEFPNEQRLHVGPGGAFEWHPEGEARPAIRHGIVHGWWDSDRGTTVGALLEFDVPDGIEPAVLARATRKGLDAAARALPGRGKVRASGVTRDEPGPESLVRVRLTVKGLGADARWARAAGEAFAAAFVRALARTHPTTRQRAK